MGFDSLVFFFFSDVIATIYLIGCEVFSYGHFNSCWLNHIFTPNPFGVGFCVWNVEMLEQERPMDQRKERKNPKFVRGGALKLYICFAHYARKEGGWRLFDQNNPLVVASCFLLWEGIFKDSLFIFWYFFLLLVTFVNYFLLLKGARWFKFFFYYYLRGGGEPSFYLIFFFLLLRGKGVEVNVFFFFSFFGHVEGGGEGGYFFLKSFFSLLNG